MIKATNIKRDYINGSVVTKVLKGIDFAVKTGEFVAIMGKSGAGKSTLLYQLGMLDKPTSGEIVIDNVDVINMSENERTKFRLVNLGYVFQDYALVPDLTVEENIIVPLLMQGISNKESRQMAQNSLEKLGIADKYKSLPNQLSGGEQQRASIARAMAQTPKILFADEPTANLDSISSEAVIDYFRELHQSGQTIVMVTHEPEYTKYCDRVVWIDDGLITDHNIKPETIIKQK